MFIGGLIFAGRQIQGPLSSSTEDQPTSDPETQIPVTTMMTLQSTNMTQYNVEIYSVQSFQYDLKVNMSI